MENLQKLEKILGYEFKNKQLLRQALTHSSYSSRLSENYERLEFLGDRVLGLTIAALLYRMFPNEPEGSLSQRHTGLVNKDCVSETARRLGLDRFVIVANEEIRENENVLCDVCEAVIGAIFIDGRLRAGGRICQRTLERTDRQECGAPERRQDAVAGNGA